MIHMYIYINADTNFVYMHIHNIVHDADVRFVSVDAACCCTDDGVTIASAFKIKKERQKEIMEMCTLH